MTSKFNKLTLLSVGVAGFGLVACGTGNKDGKPEPVDSLTVRQAIVGNTKALGADISRTAKFLEVSSILRSGFGFASSADVTVCAPAPDGGATPCETDPLDEPTDVVLDFDINDETTDLVAELERRVLADANVEAQEEFAVTYLISGAVACAEDGQPLDQECVDAFDDAEIRLVMTSPSAGDVDVDVLIGPDRVNPLSLQVHRDLIAVEADLGAIKDAATHLAGLMGETADLPATFEGRVRFEVNAPSDHEIGAVLSVLQAVKVADGDFSFSIGQSLPLYSVTLDSAAKTILGTGDLGAVDGSFPISSFTYDSTTGVETETSYDLGFHLAGATGTTLLDVANEVLTLTGMGLGPDTSTVSIDGQQVAAIDLNAADGRTLNASVTVDANDAVRIEVDPKFDLSVALQLASAVNALGDVDDWMLDEVLSIRLDGAAKPTVLIDADQLEVVDGTLTMSMLTAGITHTITAGQCMLNDAPPTVIDEGTGSEPPIEESTTPLDDVIVGACQ